MIRVVAKGNFKNSRKMLGKAKTVNYMDLLHKYARAGVDALKEATPVDSGKTSESWYYEIKYRDGVYTVTWLNSNVNDGVNIALILNTGHGTSNGGYVVGKEYIRPTIRPIFDEIAESAWREIR